MPNKTGSLISDVGYRNKNINQAGIAQVLVLVLLLAGIAIGTYLVQQRTNLKPKAQGSSTDTSTYCDNNINAIRWTANGTVKQPCASNEKCTQDGLQAYCVPSTQRSQVPYCQDANTLITSDGSVADCSAVGKKCVGAAGAARCTYQVPYCQDSTNLIASDGSIADCSAVGKKCVGSAGSAKCDVAGAAPPAAPQRPGSPGAATGAGSSTQQQAPDPAECKQRASCIYSQAPNKCFQGAQLDKTKPAGFNVNCGYVQICTKTSYSNNILGASVVCPGPGAGNFFSVRDIPFFGVLLGPDSDKTIENLKNEAQKRLTELNDLASSLNLLAQKTTDPVVQRLIAIAQGRAQTSVSSVNACK